MTTAERFPGAPYIPAVGEFVQGYEASQWYGVCAPRNTPADIVGNLNKAINAALNDPKTRARLHELGGILLPGSPVDFGKLLAGDTEKWGKVVRAANLKVE